MNSLRSIQFVVRDPLASLRATFFVPGSSTPLIELLSWLLVISGISKVCLNLRKLRPRVSTSSQGSFSFQVWLVVLERSLAQDRPRVISHRLLGSTCNANLETAILGKTVLSR